MLLIASLFSLLGLALAASRTSAPSRALVVSKSATSGQYSSIQAAVDALSTTSTTAQAIFINPGTYTEQVYIPARKAALTIYGYTTDTSSYSSNQVTITYGLSALSVSSNDKTATVRAWSANFKMYNINVVNSYGKGSQALAISASATNQGYYGCKFFGYQDTVLSETGYQVFAKSLIQGATDFIFGQHASTWFDQCDIRVVTASLGYITANGRSSSSDTSYYVINNSTVAAASGNTVKAGAFYLGRPWSQYARVVFQETSLSAVINSVGWRIWSTSEPNTSDVLFGEYDNTGPGASGTRASFATKLSSPVAITKILGNGYASATYVDTSYLS
ncbi:carbohydrate esterase family 8 protein [Cenococcum geophilum 1.58]|uniref:carbohydrate esterase family 8 protein n=1 Tax=Cenococcum geophilum 1.58 TaxID=794803 RepID=UPI00358ECA59|nr:carbohydrate esterase family 8 protein [Cenococcum geophilum 1.58]